MEHNKPLKSPPMTEPLLSAKEGIPVLLAKEETDRAPEKATSWVVLFLAFFLVVTTATCLSPEIAVFLLIVVLLTLAPKRTSPDTFVVSNKPAASPNEEPQEDASNDNKDDTYHVADHSLVDPYGDKGIYTGSLSKATDKPHGRGRLEYQDATGNATGRWYEGDWNHGRWTGQGKFSNRDGDLYEGELQDDHKHGKGTMKFAHGRVFVGEHDLKHGKGTMRFDRFVGGRVFVGEYIHGQMTEGKMNYQDGSTYEGSWEGDMRHGRGTCVFADGSIYKGEFREGEFHGHGKMGWSDGGWYEGEWWNGEIQGHGKEVRPDGSMRHEGAWSEGQPLRNRKR